MQFFHWYTADDGTWWQQLEAKAPELAAAGFTALWLPPAYKGKNGPADVGYGVYDLFDLGEFDQKGSIRTKYGTKAEYLAAIRAAQEQGMQVYADIVFNHKMGADGLETFVATPYDPQDRRRPLGDSREITAWTHFTFPARAGEHSQLHWHWWHFNAADYNALEADTSAVYLFAGKQFDEDVDDEHGNFDYLMGCNLDLNNEDVVQELNYWGEWYIDTTGVDGFRFDAVKHVKSTFFLTWLEHVSTHAQRDLFAVGEYWSADHGALMDFIRENEYRVMLFDVNLHYNFAQAGSAGEGFDLTKIFAGTLVQEEPKMAVTLVCNHDSQPLQALESVVAAWFKPLAYALILLRRDGYPCVFAADYYGAEYTDVGRDGQEHHIVIDSHRWLIDIFLTARQQYGYGEQQNYFDQPHCIGWTRSGDDDHPGGMAVLLSNGEPGQKAMKTGSPQTTYRDLTKHIQETTTTDGDGTATFSCLGRSVSVWVPVGGDEKDKPVDAGEQGE